MNESVNDTPAYEFYKYNKELEEEWKGWDIYKIEEEFNRQRVKIQSHNGPYDQKCAFKYIDNDNKQLCSTYPRLIVIPNQISMNSAIICSKFRAKERLPVLTYAYKFYSREEGRQISFLFRSSQSKPGVTSNRCIEDEQFLQYLGSIQYTPNQNQNQKTNLIIYDARPYLSAMANRFNGKGFENTQFYKNCDIKFLNIHNIHKVKESYRKMRTICLQDTSKSATKNNWFKNIDDSGYFDFISQLLEGSIQIANSLNNGMNCLVHCSDGWDRTSQLISIT